MKPNEKPEQSPLSIAQRLLQKKQFTHDIYINRKELRIAEGRRLHRVGAEIIKEDIVKGGK